MNQIKQCQKHNLPQQIVCVGEMCHRRLGCQLCIDKHEHKFYLDTKITQKPLPRVQTQITDKILHLQKYTQANVNNLRLQNYRDKFEQTFENQMLYFKNKIDEEMLNINLWIERISKTVRQSMEESKNRMLQNWSRYNATAQRHLDSITEYDELGRYFKEGDWSQSEHVEKSVSFLYSEELFFRFNRNLDALKTQINHHKKQDKQIMQWFQNRRNQFLKIEICPHKHFQAIMAKYDNKPVLTSFKQPELTNAKDTRSSIMQMIRQDAKALILYPQTMYQPFQNIYKLIRYDNQLFVTSGSRSVNIWSRVSVQPEKTYDLNFPSYGILSFVEYGKDEAECVVYGKSNGQLGLINMEKQTQVEMPAHQSAIRDIIQYDSYHFLTASQDWKLKLWAMSTQKQKQKTKKFASQRLTLTGHSGRVYSICKFGPSVLAGGCDGTIKLWDVIRQSYDEVFQQQKQIYALAQLRPQLFVSGGQLKQIRIWDYRKTKAHVCRHPIEHTCNTILKYDDNMIIFNDKNMVKVIDIRNTRQVVQRMNNDKTYTYVVNSMAFLSDNEIAMGGSDNIVSIWKY